MESLALLRSRLDSIASRKRVLEFTVTTWRGKEERVYNLLRQYRRNFLAEPTDDNKALSHKTHEYLQVIRQHVLAAELELAALEREEDAIYSALMYFIPDENVPTNSLGRSTCNNNM